MNTKTTKIVMPDIYPVTCHSKYVGPGSVFVAIQGTKDDGINYIEEALGRGAQEIIIGEQVVLPDHIAARIVQSNALLTRAENPRRCLALRSARACEFPAQKLKIIGVTGTKGKTTTSYLLDHILAHAGHKTALSTTVTSRILDWEFRSPLTTPQPDYLQLFLKLCVEAGVEIVVMEVSAQALSLSRIEGITLDGVIFTNFDHEHSEFYADIHDYFNAKCQIFNKRKPGAFACINVDDVWVKTLVGAYAGIKTFGFSASDETVRGHLVGDQHDHVAFNLYAHRVDQTLVCPSLIGKYNAYNCLASTSMALTLGVEPTVIAQALNSFLRVPGRLERYLLPNGAIAFIDYAHNPSSYEAVLSLLSTFSNNLIVVFGAGGERDRTKRPKMGCIAARYGHVLILTSDNPRSEDPDFIADEVYAGIPVRSQNNVIRELDREKAIKKAYELSQPGSIIVLLGKGPDEYQIIGKIKYPFSEATILKSLV